MSVTRRDFLKWTGLAGLTLVAPPALALPGAGGGRVLVMIELSGGNDGLNTVVPFKDPRYPELRPSLALPEAELLPVTKQSALHPSLRGVADAWEDGDIAIVNGVGYPAPNRSHFRSIEIWDQGTDADAYADAGWISRVVPNAESGEFTPAGIIVGEGGEGPLTGSNALELDDPDRLFRMVRRLEHVDPATSNPALRHLLDTQNDVLDAVSRLENFADRAPDLGAMFGRDQLQRPVQLVAELLASGMPLMAVKIRVGGFDTHRNQLGAHARLLGAVDRAIGSLRRAMKSVGRWDDVMVMTYSEFGRRPGENGAGGTDHGTAAPQIVAGGAVRGGMYGTVPSLASLDGNGDLLFTTDFRRIYSTIAEKWWGIADHEFRDFKGLAFL